MGSLALYLSNCVAGNVLIQVEVFEMDVSATESLMSSTYITIQKNLTVRHLHYRGDTIIFPRRILKFREVK